MGREIEMKFRIDNKNTFIDKLYSLGIVLSDYKNQHDKIYMLEGKSFKDLEKGECIIRIRIEENRQTTTIKKYIDGIKDRQEVECEITDVDLFEEYLKLLNFKLLVEVIKKRAVGQYLGANITVDSVSDLGDFSEIEIISNDDNVEKAKERVEEIALRLGFDASNQVKMPYDEMIYERRYNND